MHSTRAIDKLVSIFVIVFMQCMRGVCIAVSVEYVRDLSSICVVHVRYLCGIYSVSL